MRYKQAKILLKQGLVNCAKNDLLEPYLVLINS